MRKINHLSLQTNIICLLLALIGSTMIIKHPDWFGETSEIAMYVDSFASHVPPVNQ
jgi:hypothetical protein